VARSLSGALAEIAGSEHVLEDGTARARFAVDGLEPRWVARPASLDTVGRLLALAHDADLAVVPRGGGTALELGRPPARLDLVLDLSRLDRIVEYSPDDLTITVEAGVTAGTLAAHLAAHRQFLPLDPPAAAARTLGVGYRRMLSGAGHDAQYLATLCPTGMVFVPSIGGKSHCEEEATAFDDVERGANVLLQAALALAGPA